MSAVSLIFTFQAEPNTALDKIKLEAPWYIFVFIPKICTKFKVMNTPLILEYY